MERYAVLSIALLLVIITYWIYLVYKKNNIEGFESNIETLIQSDTIKKFNIKVWDNQSYLIDLYPNQPIPANYEECKSKTQNVLSACPLSIWRPTSNNYSSLGDVMARTLSHPEEESIIDLRVPIKPGLINEKPIDTIGVKGEGTTLPEDFQYVGGFGNGKIADRLEKGEKYYRLIKQIKFQMNLLITEVNKKINPLIENLKKLQSEHLNASLDIFLSLAQSASYKPLTISAKNIVNEILQKEKTRYDKFLIQVSTVNFLQPSIAENFSAFSSFFTNFGLITRQRLRLAEVAAQERAKAIEREKIEAEAQRRNQAIKNENFFYYNIIKKTVTISNELLINDLLNDLPENIRKDMINNVSIGDEFKNFSIDFYEITLSNLSFIPPEKLRFSFGNKKNYYINEPTHQPSDVYYHSAIVSPPNIKFTINYNFLPETNGTIIPGIITVGKIDEQDQIVFSYHDPLPNHPKTVSISNLLSSINDDYVTNIQNSVFKNPELIGYNDSLIASINEIKDKYKDALTNGYRKLSIWKPIPPEGYVALGYVFTNDDKNMKPNLNTISCIPQSCVKTFKRRTWDKDKDVIFKFEDGRQKFSFYRNPYLGTIVVMDEKIQNGVFDNKTPDNMPYRNEKDSLKWECYDIVPCIKEATYVDDLMVASDAAKKMCKTYKGLENDAESTDEMKKTDKAEEFKMKKLIHEKDKYIKKLMSNLNKVMTEEELYKLLNQGLNRYKLRRKLENQRKIHGEVADKLMSTRGLEISSNTPGDMSKFKELLQRLVVSQYTKQTAGKTRECPVCNQVDTQGLVRVKDTEMCFGCTAAAVREIAGIPKPK